MKVKDKFQSQREFSIEQAARDLVHEAYPREGELEQLRADLDHLANMVGRLMAHYVGESVDRLNEVAECDRFTEVEE